jgi:hypothetical protein
VKITEHETHYIILVPPPLRRFLRHNLQGAEALLHQFSPYESRNFPPFMETTDPLPSSHDITTGPIPEPDKSTPYFIAIFR